MPIASAIENRQLLSFNYDGHVRVVEPHVYGVDRKGHDALSAFQVSGGSTSGEFVGWKMFHVAGMSDVGILPGTFHEPRNGYNPEDASFSSVYVQV